MEVHAHTHTPRKKFRHYFWEFLMLFLAVFLGFIAENQREHYIEHKREKNYMKSIVEDIRKDTAILNNCILFHKARIKIVDTLLYEMSKTEMINDCRRAAELSYQTGFIDFVYNDGTIQQLKSAGGLRIIRNKKVIDTIMFYDKEVRQLYIGQEIFNRFMSSFIDHNLRFFPSMSLDRIKNKPIPILSKDKSSIEFYYGVEQQYQIFLSMLVEAHKNLLTKAEKLLVLIQKEYHLK